MFVVAIICFIIGVIVLAGGIIARNAWAIGSGVAVGIIGAVFWFFSTYVAVDPGEAKVLKEWTGVVKQEPIITPGVHWKSPFEEAIDFDVKNQVAVFIGDGNQQYNGQPTNGPQITFADRDGVAGNMDLVVLYSIKPDNVVSLVEDYTNQDDFRIKVIEQDIRSVPRDIPGRYTTIQMLTDRPTVAKAIRDALEAEWKDKGVVIEDVSIQEIRYSDAVKNRFEEAQNAQTEVVKAQAELEKAKVDAEQRVVSAEAQAKADIAAANGQAEANRVLSASLTPQILQQRYYDVLSSANLIVVPEGFTALGQIPAGAQ